MRTTNIETLAQNMGLTPYQRDVLKSKYEQYDITRLVKRGHALYAPYRPRGRMFWRAIARMRGVPADLIGGQKTLVHHRRGIKLYGGGLYSVNIGRRKLYSDDTGAPFSRISNRARS